MPQKPQKPCAVPTCPGLTRERFCGKHADLARAAKREYDRKRGTAAKRGYGYRWQKASTAFLRVHPVCAICRKAKATCVDHIEPHRGDMKLFWNRKNWQPACDPCHNRKTARGG